VTIFFHSLPIWVFPPRKNPWFLRGFAHRWDHWYRYPPGVSDDDLAKSGPLAKISYFFGVRCLDLGVFSFQVEFDAFFLNGSSELFCCRKRNMYIYGLYMSIHTLLVELTLMFWRSLWMVVEGCVSCCDSPSSSTKYVRRFCWKFAIFTSIILHIYV